MGKTYGYARVSTDDQEMALQSQALEKYGVDFIFSEHKSGKTMNRPGLKRAIKIMRRGDILVVWKLDRLGRTLMGVLEMVESLKEAGIELVSVTEQFDTTSPMGKAFMQIAMVFAELERNMISERTKAGMAARKAADPDVKWGARKAIEEHPKRLKHLQGLYNAGEFTIEVRPAGGLKWKGMTAQAFVDEINAADPKARKVKSKATIERWFHAGAPGLVQ
jgi:DNA invertase Pin-like site-specific DNA recombinase